MRVLFTADPGPGDTPRGQHYAAGEIHDLTDDQAYKWVTVLGLAVPAPAATPAAEPPAELVQEEPPAAHLLAETDPGEPVDPVA